MNTTYTHRAPSLKTITSRLGWLDNLHTTGAAKQLRAILAGPYTVAQQLARADELLETHGVERITARNGWRCYYCNAGDTYTPTLCAIKTTGGWSFQITTWGDIVEGWERRGVRVD